MKNSRLLSVVAATTLLPVISAVQTPLASASMCTAQSKSTVTPSTAATNDDALSNFKGSSLGGFNLGSSSSGGNSTPTQTGVAKQLITTAGPTHSLQFITGPKSPDRTDKAWGITSTDLGVAYGDGSHTYFAFGDTGSCRTGDDGWRSNTLVRTSDKNYGDGITIDQALTRDGWTSSGTAKQFIPSLQAGNDDFTEVTTIPTAGIVIDGVHYVDYMSVKHWGDAGQWATNYAATMRSTDGGVHWDVVTDSVRVNNEASKNFDYIMPGKKGYATGNENLQMSAFIEKDGYVYRFSTPNGRFGSAYLSRAPKDQFPAEDAFKYWDGSSWSDDAAAVSNPSAALFGDRVSELSVTYNEYLGKYIAMYLVEGTGLVVRTADSLTGPWSDTRLLVSTSTVPDLYGGFVVPNQDDQNLYYVLTTWSEYNVYFMRTDLDFALENNITSDNIVGEEVVVPAQ